jgi:hypothetical protein
VVVESRREGHASLGIEKDSSERNTGSYASNAAPGKPNGLVYSMVKSTFLSSVPFNTKSNIKYQTTL